MYFHTDAILYWNGIFGPISKEANLFIGVHEALHRAYSGGAKGRRVRSAPERLGYSMTLIQAGIITEATTRVFWDTMEMEQEGNRFSLLWRTQTEMFPVSRNRQKLRTRGTKEKKWRETMSDDVEVYGDEVSWYKKGEKSIKSLNKLKVWVWKPEERTGKGGE